MLATLFIAAIYLMTLVKPELGPPAEIKMAYRQRFAALVQALPITIIIVVTVGGIYLGVYSATEAAGIGCILAFIFALFRRSLTWSNFADAVKNTLRSTATTFLILIGAFVFTPFIALSGIPDALLDLLTGLELGKFGLLAIVLVFLVLLGTFMEGFAILVLTLPLLEPVLRSFGIDMVWYGVLMVIVLEMGLISPPVGINVFVVKSIAGDVPMNDIFKGIFPFWLAMGLALLILVFFPGIALLLPNTMFN
jgi:tripartite ATP-independent transporter DctM subunit